MCDFLQITSAFAVQIGKMTRGLHTSSLKHILWKTKQKQNEKIESGICDMYRVYAFK